MTYPPSSGGQNPYGAGQAPYGAPQQTFGQPVGAPPPGYGLPPIHAGYPQSSPGYGGAPVQPSGVTGVIAAILALLGVLPALYRVVTGLLGGFRLLTHDFFGGFGTFAGVWSILVGVLNIAVLVLLLWGGIELVQRKMRGRRLVILGAGIVIATGVIGILVSVIAGAGLRAELELTGGSFGGALVVSVIIAVALLLFPIATLVLAYVPSTVAWIQAKPQSGDAGNSLQQFQTQGYPAQQFPTTQQNPAQQQYPPQQPPYGQF